MVREERYSVVCSVNPVFDGTDSLAAVEDMVNKAAGMAETVERAGIAVQARSVVPGVVHILLKRRKMSRFGGGVQVADNYHHTLGILNIIRFADGAHLLHHQV